MRARGRAEPPCPWSAIRHLQGPHQNRCWWALTHAHQLESNWELDAAARRRSSGLGRHGSAVRRDVGDLGLSVALPLGIAVMTLGQRELFFRRQNEPVPTDD